MKIFLTYASEDRNTAEQVYFALAGNNHTVFFDCAELPPSTNYNSRIRQAIIDSDLLVFLISEDSVKESSYSLTELAFAHNKWPHPREVVIPVMARKTHFDRIPNYLKAVTILEPKGHVAAEVADEISKIAERRINRAKIIQALSKYWLAPMTLGVAALVLVTGMLGGESVNDGNVASDEIIQELKHVKAKMKTIEA